MIGLKSTNVPDESTTGLPFLNFGAADGRTLPELLLPLGED